jgi:methionyl-tRNA formyltransferase
VKPWPGAYFIDDGKKIIVWKLKKHRKKPTTCEVDKIFKCADGWLELLEYQVV